MPFNINRGKHTFGDANKFKSKTNIACTYIQYLSRKDLNVLVHLIINITCLMDTYILIQTMCPPNFLIRSSKL